MTNESTDREISETVHCMNETKQAFRLLVLRWPNPQPDLFATTPYFYHAVATNREESASAVIHLHNQRGESENWHKELKLGYGMEQMPCGELEANALFFAIGVLAYNLGVLLKAQLLPEQYRHSTVQTGLKESIADFGCYFLLDKAILQGICSAANPPRLANETLTSVGNDSEYH